MWRAFFLAVGIYCVILGAECLAVEQAILATEGSRPIIPPSWAPWSLMSAGAVVAYFRRL